MIIVLLIIIIFLLIPGGTRFLARLWAAICMLIGLGIGYYFLGKIGLWIVGGFGLLLLAQSLLGNGKRPGPSSGATRDFESPRQSVSKLPTSTEAPPPIVTSPPTASVPAVAKSVNPDDPFGQMVIGRIVKRALPDLGDLLAQPGMIEVFKKHSNRFSRSSSSGKEIWYHPAGIYMAVPAPGSERLFSTMASAQEYHRQYSARS